MENDDLIDDVDIRKRSEDEWSDIYHIQLVESDIDNEAMDEFEWAYKLNKSKYFLKPSKNNDYEIAENMEMRGMKIYRDIFCHADTVEKKMLNNGYMTTKYILNYLNKR